MRPSTLREVSEKMSGQADPVKVFSEFLDYFYDCATEEEMSACLAEEPVLLSESHWNAILAASADYLAKRYRMRAFPLWVLGPERFLPEPWFRETSDEMRAYLTFQSPAEFRMRGLYVEAVPLRRARTWQAEERLQQRLKAGEERAKQTAAHPRAVS
nr:hypothetical protein [uncultured Gellertiella sp.]